MKNTLLNSRNITLFFLIFLGIFLVITLQRSEHDAPNTLRVGILTYDSEDTFINTLSAKVTASLRQREVDLDKKITVDVSSANGDQNEQNIQVDRYLNQKYDVLLVNLVDRTFASTVIQK